MFESGIDLTPLVEAAFTLLSAVLSAVAVWVGAVIRTRFKFAADFDAGQILDAAIHRGIDYAKKAIVGSDGKVTIQLNNAIVELAARYVIDKLPDTIKHFGFDEGKIKQLILARLDAVIDVPEIGEAPLAPKTNYNPIPAGE